MKTAACLIMALIIGGPAMSPKKETNSTQRRTLMSFETGAGMQQYDSRPCVTLYSDGEVWKSDAAYDDDNGHRMMVLDRAVVERIVTMIDELEAREVKHKIHKHDAKTHTYAAWKTSGERIVLRSGNGDDAWNHPQAGGVMGALGAILALTGP